MPVPIQGLHHVTATVDLAQPDLDCYTGLLGLRLVKRTVNFDNHFVYHFYYGDELGTPGTIMTTFPYHGMGVAVGRKGAGQVTATAFVIPPGSLPGWRERLRANGIACSEGVRFGAPFLSFADPSSLTLELIEAADRRTPWTGSPVPADSAIRGIHSVTLTVARPEPTAALLADRLGWRPGPAEGDRIRFAAGDGADGRLLDVVADPAAPAAVNGLGTVHHVAMAIESAEAQLAAREELLSLGLKVTEVRDRQYFRSIYFREPGGILYEIATTAPGFPVDEAPERLGEALKLPPWEEANRPEIEARLPPVRVPPRG